MTSKTSVFAKVRDAVLALGRSERTAARKARLLSSASYSDFLRLTPEQNARLGLPPRSPLRPRASDNARDADYQCASVRDEAGQRAIWPLARDGHPSSAARRALLCLCRPARASRQGRDYPRGEQGSRGHQKAAVVRRGRSEPFAGQAAARNVASDL